MKNGIKSYNYIRSYFNELNSDHNHFVNSNDICTPMECVKEMIDSVPNGFWNKSKLKILDSCCGNGNFHAYAATKTHLKNLYFNEINEKRIENAKKYFGNKINLTTKDFLTFEETEEYDMVVSNPPYAMFNNGERVSKNHNLSRLFIEKAIKITKPNGYILFIVPNNWMSFADRNILPSLLSKYQFLRLDINGAKKWFPKVGSSFTWFLLQKKENKTPFLVTNNYIIKDSQRAKLDREVNFIPLYYSEDVRSIFNKTINNKNLPKYKLETSSDLHKYTKGNLITEKEDDEHSYRLIHTPTQTVFSARAHKFQTGYKVFVPLTNQYEPFVDNCGMTQSIAFVRCVSKNEAEKHCKDLSNYFYRFINNITRYGNFNNVRVLQNLPLWDTFKLNKREIDFIHSFNGAYYGEKREYQ